MRAVPPEPTHLFLDRRAGTAPVGPPAPNRQQGVCQQQLRTSGANFTIRGTSSAALEAHSSQQTVHRLRLSATLSVEQENTVSAAWESKGHFPCAATTVACTLEQMTRGCSLQSY